jgi:predicted protein tyrosine phosphatase
MKIKRDGIEQEIETICTSTIEAVISRDEIQCAINQGVLDKENLVLISIGEPGDSYRHSILSKEQVQGFKDCLQIEFWDIEEDFGEYKIITDTQAKTIQNFILVNLQRDADTRFIVNCKAGKSRSAAVARSIECLKFFGIGEEAKYNYKTCFESEIYQHSRYTPNLTVFDKIVKDYNQIPKLRGEFQLGNELQTYWQNQYVKDEFEKELARQLVPFKPKFIKSKDQS